METNKSAIIDKAARIILNTGLEALTIHNLAKELKVEEKRSKNWWSKIGKDT